eukprot:COSAG02_NODE_15442_length_1171_cov_1.208955_2_plen_74_part_01
MLAAAAAALLLLLLRPAVADVQPGAHLVPLPATVGNIWSQLSTWGPCDALDGCAWHGPVTTESAKVAAPYIRRV